MNQCRKILSIGLICTFVAVLAVGEPACSQTSEPILSVEVGTHNAGIMRIAIDPSNRILVTGSEDKTVRVWDISGHGELLRILRPRWVRVMWGGLTALPFLRTGVPWPAADLPARRRQAMRGCSFSILIAVYNCNLVCNTMAQFN